MHVPDGGGNFIYNLVITRRVDGNNSPDFVMRYEFIDQNIFEHSQMQEKKFKGKINAFSFESFLQALGETSKGNITEPCYNDIPSD